MSWSKSLVYWISSTIISTILFSLGTSVLNQNKYIAIITILIAFVLLYVSYYAYQITDNEKRIEQVEDKMKGQEEILNTLKDIVILKKVSKIR